ncbi:uncharacterized protein LOC143522372 [Brachyhypopomus gauderio]|uniref:uncharacterized protein LOC143522372 n=1 Tax=Brachyhypopomus gauderio TaxID=698409 RepID=UPI004043595B
MDYKTMFRDVLVRSQTYEKELQQLEASKHRALEEMQQMFEAELEETTHELDQCRDKLQQQEREFEETKNQMEAESNFELEEMRAQYECRLREEEEKHYYLVDTAAYRKVKIIDLENKIKNKNLEISQLMEYKQKLQEDVQSRDKDIVALKSEIQEKDMIIQDKETHIQDLEWKYQDLEKTKIELDENLKHLKTQIEPREIYLKETEKKIREMTAALKQYKLQNIQLHVSNDELKRMLKAKEKELNTERQKVKNGETLVCRIKSDIINCIRVLQEPKKLKETVRKLYEHHVQGSDVCQEEKVSADVQSEFRRQRDYLEKKVASLTRKLAENEQKHKSRYDKLAEENFLLIREINEQRLAQDHVKKQTRAVQTQARGTLSKSSTHHKTMAERAVTQLTSEDKTEQKIQLRRPKIERLKLRGQGLSPPLPALSPSTKLPALKLPALKP